MNAVLDASSWVDLRPAKLVAGAKAETVAARARVERVVNFMIDCDKMVDRSMRFL